MDVLLLTLTVVSIAAAAGFGVTAWRSMDNQRRRSAARVAALSAAIDGESNGTYEPAPVAVSSMFAATPGASVRGRPLIKAAVVAAMVIVLIVFVAMSTRDHGTQPETAAVASSPLELVSMRHTREGNTLTVTGLVRNPDGGAAVGGIAAVVFAFDRDGNFVVSGRAPLDFTSLAPGDESPFVVTLTNVADVGRYRVSFRTDTGVLRHVDRRAQSQLALHE